MKEYQKTRTGPASTVYDRDLYELSYADADWNAARRLLARCIRKGKPGSILDIGCGLGFFVECCYRFGVPCTGIEGSAYAVEAARKREPGLDVRQHYLEDSLPFPDGSFSMVVCNQVIEHLPATTARHALREAYRVLSGGGAIFVYSPSIFNRTQAQDPTHINLHSPRSLKAELTAAGFGQVRGLNNPLKFTRGPLTPLNHVIRALFTIVPVSFLSSTANCMATKPEKE
jgi:SAM-dependent methyltransferase